jgi:hypothetical protein
VAHCMRVQILFRDPRYGDHRFMCTPAEFAPSLVRRTNMGWLRRWLKWQLYTRHAPIPKLLARCPDPVFEDYCNALAMAGVREMELPVSSPPLPQHAFARTLRTIRRSLGYESGLKFIDITNYGDRDIEFMIAETIEGRRGSFYCSHCDRTFRTRELARGEWQEPVVELTGAGGRDFACPNGHMLFVIRDWIS